MNTATVGEHEPPKAFGRKAPSDTRHRIETHQTNAVFSERLLRRTYSITPILIPALYVADPGRHLAAPQSQFHAN